MRYESIVLKTFNRTPDTLSLRFQKPKEFNYSPGQFTFLSIENKDKKLVKHFTISSSPSEDFLEITKKLTGHEYSNTLLTLKKGDGVTLDGPYGDFIYLGEPEKVLFLTGGIGITPIRSMIRYCADKAVNSDMKLIYSCSNENSIIFKEEFNELQDLNNKLRVFYTITKPEGEWSGLVGRINSQMIMKLVPDYNSRLTYVSGPPNMVDAMTEILIKNLDVSPDRVKKRVSKACNSTLVQE